MTQQPSHRRAALRRDGDAWQLLAIDPSIRSLGFAMLACDQDFINVTTVADAAAGIEPPPIPVRFSPTVLSVGTIRQLTPTSIPYHRRAQAMVKSLVDLFPIQESGFYADLWVAIEAPTNWSTRRGSDSKNAEAIQRLYYLVGGLVSAFTNRIAERGFAGCGRVVVVHPMSWKGQKPKSVMVQRAHATADLKLKTPHDACEALLLAYHALKHYDVDTGQMRAPYITIDDLDHECEMVYNEWL